MTDAAGAEHRRGQRRDHGLRHVPRAGGAAAQMIYIIRRQYIRHTFTRRPYVRHLDTAAVYTLPLHGGEITGFVMFRGQVELIGGKAALRVGQGGRCTQPLYPAAVRQP
jgi:hypothetical protein